MKLLCILITLFLYSCNGLGPIDRKSTKNISEKPAEQELSGEWEVDNFSYNLIKEQYDLKARKVELILRKDGKFEAINFPDFVADGFGKTINRKFVNATGEWTTELDKGIWVLNMRFDKGELFQSGMDMSYDLYEKDSELVIWTFIGDPDQGDRLMFKKREKQAGRNKESPKAN